jgi:cytochrome c peroxidase
VCAQLVLGAALQIQINPKLAGEALQPASLRYQTSAGENFSVTRLSYLVSDFALQRPDGSWLEYSNSVGWLDLEQDRDSLRLEDVPPGEFHSIRFSLGLTPQLNHADPAQFPAEHPLNPNLNGLHWSWQGGYIFLALEGLWRKPSGVLDGWAFHLARDTNCTRITLAAALELTNETSLQLDFDLATLLNAPCPLSFAKDGSSTHSRDGDPVAGALVRNLAGAFSVRKIRALSTAQHSDSSPKPLYLPDKFTPYEFKMSTTFPIPEFPRDNPLITERVELGRTLFFDKQLSVNNQQSCADCHLPAKAFTDGRRESRGAEGQSGTRNAMPLVNLAWKRSFFWDGRAPSLRAQVLQPIENPLEMRQSLANLVEKLAGAADHSTHTDTAVQGRARLSSVRRKSAPAVNPAIIEEGVLPAPSRPRGGFSDYPALFAAAFGTPEITTEKISLALENFLLTLTSSDSKFDRALRGEVNLSPDEQYGFELFSTEYDPRRGQFGADCFHCHGGPLFQSQTFANNGLDTTFSDPGRAKVTGKDADMGKFAVPSLRNVALTAPYMHDGRFSSLEEVIDHYATGVKRSLTLDPNLAKHPDGGVPLTQKDKQALVAFLKTLTDPRLLASGGN